MAEKTPRIDDVKRPDKVAPAATSRPLLVTNRPTLASDPMMTQAVNEEKPAGTAEVPMNHAAKTIKPLGDVTEEAAQPNQSELAEKPAANSPQATSQPGPGPETKPTAASQPVSPPSETASVSTADESEDVRDPDAVVSAEEIAAAEAKSKRDDELEQLIASEKYTVPINAVQRRRSRTNTMVLGLFAVLLAVVLVDAVADVGLVKLPSSVPHTHYFSGR